MSYSGIVVDCGGFTNIELNYKLKLLKMDAKGVRNM